MTETTPTSCPRCASPLRNEHGDLVCLTHGTQWTPKRAWDALEEPPPANKRAMAANSGKPWTREQRAFVLANKDVLSSAQIAADPRIQRTEHAVNQVLHKASLPKVRQRNMSESSQVRGNCYAVSEQLEDGARPGILRRVANRLGLTHGAAQKRLERAGISVREADGMMSVAEVALEYRCTRHRVEVLMSRGLLHGERLGDGRGARWRIAPEEAERAAPLLRARSKHDPRARRRR